MAFYQDAFSEKMDILNGLWKVPPDTPTEAMQPIVLSLLGDLPRV